MDKKSVELLGRMEVVKGKIQGNLTLADIRHLEENGLMTGYSVPNPDGSSGYHFTPEAKKIIMG